LDLAEELMVKLKNRDFTSKDVIPQLAKLTNISKKALYSKWSDLCKYDD